jgi:hypothetical protein
MPTKLLGPSKLAVKCNCYREIGYLKKSFCQQKKKCNFLHKFSVTYDEENNCKIAAVSSA